MVARACYQPGLQVRQYDQASSRLPAWHAVGGRAGMTQGPSVHPSICSDSRDKIRETRNHGRLPVSWFPLGSQRWCLCVFNTMKKWRSGPRKNK